MMSKPDTCILIVENGTVPAAELRAALQDVDVTVHVVGNVNAGLTVARSKRLSGAIIDRNSLQAARPLCAELTKADVPYLFHGPLSGDVEDVIATLLSAEPPSSRVLQQV
jgi:hypothetical protein